MVMRGTHGDSPARAARPISIRRGAGVVDQFALEPTVPRRTDRPRMVFMVVDLPEAFLPSRQTISPSATSRLTARKPDGP
jgi:hypothetical protein